MNKLLPSVQLQNLHVHTQKYAKGNITNPISREMTWLAYLHT